MGTSSRNGLARTVTTPATRTYSQVAITPEDIVTALVRRTEVTIEPTWALLRSLNERPGIDSGRDSLNEDELAEIENELRDIFRTLGLDWALAEVDRAIEEGVGELRHLRRSAAPSIPRGVHRVHLRSCCAH
ncbi:hypothetical protein GCM10010492_71210 [Saccharothrix mutabilis subsp. mutabilis]|uniref:Uncharacterized protein n=1 Tax=Saccharothrix mutabilis subsp. mutabilis TaxID=66855 RepID=A0ABN0USC9_9PSEU